jgi:hypothetical protein
MNTPELFRKDHRSKAPVLFGGCLLVTFLAVLVASSVQTDFGKVEVTNLTYDNFNAIKVRAHGHPHLHVVLSGNRQDLPGGPFERDAGDLDVRLVPGHRAYSDLKGSDAVQRLLVAENGRGSGICVWTALRHDCLPRWDLVGLAETSWKAWLVVPSSPRSVFHLT